MDGICVLTLNREVFEFDGCNSVGKRGVFKSGLMPISSLDNSVVTCMLSRWRSIQSSLSP